MIGGSYYDRCGSATSTTATAARRRRRRRPRRSKKCACGGGVTALRSTTMAWAYRMVVGYERRSQPRYRCDGTFDWTTWVANRAVNRAVNRCPPRAAIDDRASRRQSGARVRRQARQPCVDAARCARTTSNVMGPGRARYYQGVSDASRPAPVAGSSAEPSVTRTSDLDGGGSCGRHLGASRRSRGRCGASCYDSNYGATDYNGNDCDDYWDECLLGWSWGNWCGNWTTPALLRGCCATATAIARGTIRA